MKVESKEEKTSQRKDTLCMEEKNSIPGKEMTK